MGDKGVVPVPPDVGASFPTRRMASGPFIDQVFSNSSPYAGDAPRSRLWQRAMLFRGVGRLPVPLALGGSRPYPRGVRCVDRYRSCPFCDRHL